MNIDKDQILQLLKSQGDHDKAEQAQQELPDKVDTDSSTHQDLLAKFGINSSTVMDKLGSLGGSGGIGGAIGKLI